MSIAYPDSLRVNNMGVPVYKGFRFKLRSPVKLINRDSGRIDVRRSFSRASMLTSFMVYFNYEQLLQFNEFYYNTLNNGSINFTFRELDGIIKPMSISQDYAYKFIPNGVPKVERVGTIYKVEWALENDIEFGTVNYVTSSNISYNLNVSLSNDLRLNMPTIFYSDFKSAKSRVVSRNNCQMNIMTCNFVCDNKADYDSFRDFYMNRAGLGQNMFRMDLQFESTTNIKTKSYNCMFLDGGYSVNYLGAYNYRVESTIGIYGLL